MELVEYSHTAESSLDHVTPGFEKVTECIPYVRQDQVPHI
jgi:hypothetical protein